MVVKEEDGTYTIVKDGFGELKSKYYEELTDCQYDYLVKKFKEKPDMKYVIYDINSVAQGNSVYPNIKKYYFFDLQAKTLLHKRKFTIEEVFADKELLSVLYARTKTNDVFFTSDDLYDNIMTIIRTACGSYTGKPASFPINIVDMILKKYNVNNNYYDFSCGWGDRMLGAIRNNVNYYGTDPNYILCDRLNALKTDYAKYSLKKLPTVEINCCGSEVFIPAYYNSIGVAFSSPPYFSLEDYKIGEQSYKEGMSYESWMNGFMSDTMKNIYDYLIPGGFYCLCIKNFDKFLLEQDSVALAEKIGFTFIRKEKCSIISRVNSSTGKTIDSDENIYVFMKEKVNGHYHNIPEGIETVLCNAKPVFRTSKKKLF